MLALLHPLHLIVPVGPKDELDALFQTYTKPWPRLAPLQPWGAAVTGLSHMVRRGESSLVGSWHCPNQPTSALCPGRYRDCLPRSCFDMIRQQIIVILPKLSLSLKAIRRVAAVKGDWECC